MAYETQVDAILQPQSDVKQLVESLESLSPQQAYFFVGAVLGSVAHHVTDRSVKLAIQHDISRIAGAQTSHNR